MTDLFDLNLTIAEMQELIANGADVNERDVRGRTPLHYPANFEVAKLLIEHGADVNASDNYDTTPLHNASYKGEYETVKLLIDAGADINAKDCDGITPLMYAHDDDDLRDYLISKGAIE